MSALIPFLGLIESFINSLMLRSHQAFTRIYVFYRKCLKFILYVLIWGSNLVISFLRGSIDFTQFLNTFVVNPVKISLIFYQLALIMMIKLFFKYHVKLINVHIYLHPKIIFLPWTIFAGIILIFEKYSPLITFLLSKRFMWLRKKHVPFYHLKYI